MTELNLNIYEIYKRSFPIFCKSAMGHLIGAYHTEIINRLLSEIEKKGQKQHQSIMVARGHGKTTVFSCDFPLWYLFKSETPKTILIYSMNQRMARRILGLIRSQLHSSPVFSGYKFKVDTSDTIELYLPGHEGDDRFIHTIYSIPVGTRGPHADLVISDDILKDEKGESATNVIQLKELWWSSAFPMTATKKGIHFLIGTPISGEDIFVDLEELAIKNKSWAFHRYPAVYDEGEETERALFPELLSLQDEHDTRDACPTYVWDREYMLRNISTRNSMFPEKLITQCIDLKYDNNEEDHIEERQFFLGWDVAISSEASADFSALVVISKGAKGPLILEEIWHEKGMDFPEQEKLAMQLVKKYKIQKGLIEKKGISESLANKVMANIELTPYIDVYNPTNEKKSIILGNLNLVMKHKMFCIPSYINYSTELIRELQMFSVINKGGNQTYKAASGHDDLVIALSLAVAAAGTWAFEDEVPTTIEII